MSETKPRPERSLSSSKQNRLKEAVSQFDNYENKKTIRNKLYSTSSTPILPGLPQLSEPRLTKPKVLTLEQFKQKVALGKQLNSSFSVSHIPQSMENYKLDMSMTVGNESQITSLAKNGKPAIKARLPGILNNKIDKIDFDRINKAGLSNEINHNPRLISDSSTRNEIKPNQSTQIIRTKTIKTKSRVSTPTRTQISIVNQSSSPSKRKEGKSGYTITVPLIQFLEENSKEMSIYEMTKFLPLELYDPIIDPETPRKLLEKLKTESKDGQVRGYSK